MEGGLEGKISYGQEGGAPSLGWREGREQAAYCWNNSVPAFLPFHQMRPIPFSPLHQHQGVVMTLILVNTRWQKFGGVYLCVLLVL